MDMFFLGTGAAEAIPAVYCRCNYCVKARKNGGKDVRSRSSFRIDERHQIDLSPDIYFQMQKYGLDLYDLEHILITHSHEDHFDIAEILSKEMAVINNGKPVYIYLSTSAAKWAKTLINTYLGNKNENEINKIYNKYRLVPVDYFEMFKAGDLEVTSLKANHKALGENEYGLNYIIKLKNGKTMLYGVDTGYYEQDTWEFLEGKKVDILVMEATFGGRYRGFQVSGHLDVKNLISVLERMEQIGFIEQSTNIYATHINHKHDLMHDDMQKVFDSSSFRVTVAYDGLRIP
ncbi:MAG: MBL fold metallo-hydrolase [Firmicutes bacterium]|nr:MBL fold metallo-hydrolase [Bacillota bacterium]